MCPSGNIIGISNIDERCISGEVSQSSVYLRAEDFFKIKNLLDVVDLLLPRLSSAGVSVLPSHGAALPVRVRLTRGLRAEGCGEKDKSRETCLQAE